MRDHPSLSRRAALVGAAAVATVVACRAAAPPADRSQQRARARPDLYHCEGCDGALERNAATLSWQARIAPAAEPGQPLRIEGRVFKADGKTLALGVVVYAYHTNAHGLYANGTAETEWSRRHGRLRAWVKTDAQGRYAFDTIKPAPYPGRDISAHVHLTILEPGRRSYYIDDIVFDGEFGVTPSYRARQELRGGSGIVRLSRASDDTLLAHRDIILERLP